MKINLIYLLYYLLTTNLIAALVFYMDKQKARKGKYRTKEKKLHLIELLGGVFIILPMLYMIRHKNRKTSYYAYTYLIFCGWITILILALQFNLFEIA
ncbi:MAG: DUF1294 domain-containing protein [Bacteroidales bacterium]|nr:DUF1294 domain-containing protein [Bacteroidales bacterium]